MVVDFWVTKRKFAHSEPGFNRFVRCQRDDSAATLSHTANMASQNAFPLALKAARNNKGWTLERLAEAAETSKGYLSDLERGKRPMPGGTMLERLALALGVPPEDLTRTADGSGRTVPLVGYVGAGAIAHYYATADEGLGEVEAPDGATTSTVAVEVRGTSLGPLFESWLIFYDDVRSPVTSDLFGVLCVVGLPDDRVLVKRLRPAKAAGFFHLESNNEPTMADQEVAWAARVKSMRPR